MYMQRKLAGFLFLRATYQLVQKVVTSSVVRTVSLLTSSASGPASLNLFTNVPRALGQSPPPPFLPLIFIRLREENDPDHLVSFSVHRNVLCVSILELGRSQRLPLGPLLLVSRLFFLKPVCRGSQAELLMVFVWSFPAPCPLPEPTLPLQVGEALLHPCFPLHLVPPYPSAPMVMALSTRFSVFLLLCFQIGNKLPLSPAALPRAWLSGCSLPVE